MSKIYEDTIGYRIALAGSFFFKPVMESPEYV